MSDTPETIYLVPDSTEGDLLHYLWCQDPAPGIGMDPRDAVEYRRADVVEATLAKQAKAAKNGMDAAHKASSQKLKAAQRLRNESRPELIDSERQANAQLTAQIEYLEQLAADRLAQNTADAERIAELEAQAQRDAELRKKQGLILDYAMRGLRHSAEHPDDGRMQAVRALAKHSDQQAERIAALLNKEAS